jgi:hypothetical protein
LLLKIILDDYATKGMEVAHKKYQTALWIALDLSRHAAVPYFCFYSRMYEIALGAEKEEEKLQIRFYD